MSAPSEIAFLARFLVDWASPSTSLAAAQDFADRISSRYLPHHWHPLQPERGSGFRAISFDPNRKDGYLDPVLQSLSLLLDLSPRALRRSIADRSGRSSWTVWCDPGCVSIRNQAGGGELRELWGSLPGHLSHLTRPAIGTPPRTGANTPSIIHRSAAAQTASVASPSKSRAIPILAPSSAAKLAGITSLSVIPPTPVQADHRQRCVSGGSSDMSESGEVVLDVANAGVLPHHHSRGHHQRMTSEDDPYLRPSSRTSSASSSSDGSDHSAFSVSSSSTATSVSPNNALFNLNQKATKPPSASTRGKTYASSHPNYCHSTHNRHQSTNSLPPTAIQNRPHTPNGFPRQPQPSHRRRHGPSASLGGGRSILVLKEGPGVVTEHSGGKVGVMGGGVLLGLPSKTNSNKTSVIINHQRH